MRRDVYLENDSGGFSVVAVDAVDAIIEDARSDDAGFVSRYKALLLMLYGDDSLPVRIVVDEPLQPDEEAQWLARVSRRIDTSDGRILVMGGFDPDVLSWWKDDHGGVGDGRGVAEFQATPGSWRVDVYAHVGSMNGRAILSERAEQPPGAAFRASHEDAPFPLWLANMLEFSGEEDPGHEDLWNDVKASIAAGDLAVDVDGAAAIGLLVHVTPFSGELADASEATWFDYDAGARVPEVFPLGLPTTATDPAIESFRDKLTGRVRVEPERPVADRVVEVIEAWTGDTLTLIEGGEVAVPLTELYLLHWVASLTADSPPRFELWVDAGGRWPAPDATADYAVAGKSGGVIAIGPVANTGGWHVWWTSRSVAALLGDVPDGASIDLAMAPIADDADPSIGRALYSGVVRGGHWYITQASPAVAHDVLRDAIAFARGMADNRLPVREADRDAFARAEEEYGDMAGEMTWDGDAMSLADPDERMMIMLATPVFRARFASQWPMDANED